MAGDRYLIAALFLMCNLAVALSDCAVSCYRIEPATVAGIISADLLLTLVIVTVTYRCARVQFQRKEKNAHKVYMNVRTNCKS